MSHVRIRCTGLIVEDNAVLLIKYDEGGVHYNLPGGGLEPGETVVEGVAREIREETTAAAEVGKLALVFEFAPHKQSGSYDRNERHSINLIFECKLANGSIPKMPDVPDGSQTGVEWVPLNELENILLIPNIGKQIKDYCLGGSSIDLIEDYRLAPLKLQ